MKNAILALSLFGLSSATDSSNPFLGKKFYVNPSFQKELDTSIASASGAIKASLLNMRDAPSAYWLDTRDKIKSSGLANDTATMEGILKHAASISPAPLVSFIVYDLPNRDCHAHASNGEICCAYNEDKTCDYLKEGDCSDALTIYKTDYIDPIAAVVKEYQDRVPIVLVIEPDSLPNLATNKGDPRCGSAATVNAYKSGIAYAVSKIAEEAPKVTMYLDAAHGGWLGWTNSLNDYLDLVDGLGIMDKLRGFSTNVANYQPVGVQCPFYDHCLNNANPNDTCCADPCKLVTQYNTGNNELNYALTFYNVTQTKFNGKYSPSFIIDTGRNGQTSMRDSCSNWCNIRGAGVGVLPTTDTANPKLVDAYFWLKVKQ